ncbi:hypothetical protein LCL96_16195 [Rossellomorea aquimaris]|uniref:hypothetical protein n=1 Tax=Rossellomorea aquimaris TaxID=189382 RepID=UPI001CD3AC66|nr:hypothetical protein [Rossellomorea aquimaris]MCA1060479.1 hypothetical protein [Rossellomorea aquimaris]
MKKYSWLSYVSAGIPLVLFVLLFNVSNINDQSIIYTIFYTLFIGAPFSLILSIIALKKRNEKNGFALVGLTFAVLLTVSILYVLVLGFGMGEA